MNISVNIQKADLSALITILEEDLRQCSTEKNKISKIIPELKELNDISLFNRKLEELTERITSILLILPQLKLAL